MNTYDHEFKLGDFIRMKESCSGAVKGEIYQLTNFKGKRIMSPEYPGWEGRMVNLNGGGWACSCEDKWEYITTDSEVVKMLLLKQ